MKTIQKNAVKGFIAAVIIACFAINVQAQSKMSADTSKMAKKKMSKMAMKKDTSKMMKKPAKMKMDKMKMKKDTMSKM
jgi:hypothetical protein